MKYPSKTRQRKMTLPALKKEKKRFKDFSGATHKFKYKKGVTMV
jgi:hypothetical protein